MTRKSAPESLPPLNDGRVYQGVRVTLRSGETLVGCTYAEGGGVDDDGSRDECLEVFLAETVLPRRVSPHEIATVDRFALPEAPDCTWRENYQKTGGIVTAGPNPAFHRRHIIAGEPVRGRAPLMLVNPDDASLRDFCARHPDVHIDGLTIDDEHGNRLVPASTCGSMIAETIYALALQQPPLECVSLASRLPSIVCDTLVRAKHTYAQLWKSMKKHLVGPKRDLWRFLVTHLPPHWRCDQMAPFTWEAFARHAFGDVGLSEVGALPQPLQSFVRIEGPAMCDELLEESPGTALRLARERNAADAAWSAARDERDALDALLDTMRRFPARAYARWSADAHVLARERDALRATARDLDAARDAARRACATHAAFAARVHDLREQLRTWRGATVERHRCAPLTDAQQRQGNHLFHVLKYGAALHDEVESSAARAALLQYNLQGGVMPHLVTVYEQSGRFIGYGDDLRHAPADESALPAEVRNRLKRAPDGTLRGAGGPGCKGIVHAPRNGREMYQPKKKHRRLASDNPLMDGKQLRTAA
ncbi:MAG: hypothetical protein CMN93_07715 [Synechococcus sp. CPC35]|nr:hypothetical protein [Synechococcus sp. CPC35]